MAASLVCVALGFGLLTLVGGCNSGPAKVNITGTVSKNGQPLKVGQQGVIEVKFGMQGERGKVKSTEADRETGNFEIKGIEVGKYKVSVRQLDPYPTNDLLDGAFDLRSTPIVRDVQSDGQVFEIDLGKEGAK